jgi:hypothetical protein
VVDAWIPGKGGFQVTINPAHTLHTTAKSLLKNVKRDGDGEKLYWLLPPDIYPTFTKKSPKCVDQYAVLLELPTVLPKMNAEQQATGKESQMDMD